MLSMLPTNTHKGKHPPHLSNLLYAHDLPQQQSYCWLRQYLQKTYDTAVKAVLRGGTSGSSKYAVRRKEFTYVIWNDERTNYQNKMKSSQIIMNITKGMFAKKQKSMR